MDKDLQVLGKGSYTVVVMALWNQAALENSDFQRVLLTVHAPCATQLQV